MTRPVAARGGVLGLVIVLAAATGAYAFIAFHSVNSRNHDKVKPPFSVVCSGKKMVTVTVTLTKGGVERFDSATLAAKPDEAGVPSAKLKLVKNKDGSGTILLKRSREFISKTRLTIFITASSYGGDHYHVDLGSYLPAPAAPALGAAPEMPRIVIDAPADKARKAAGEHERRRKTLRGFERYRKDWERQVLGALEKYIEECKSAKGAKSGAIQAWDAIEIARLFTIRAAIPGIKKVVSLGAENNSLIRPAMRALNRLGVDDDYWLKCLSGSSKNGRDYVACGALCEVWDSKSPKIQSAIQALRKKLTSSKGVDYSKGIPAVLHMLSAMEALDKSYLAARPEEQLKIVETALRRGQSALGHKWAQDYFGRPLNDYNHLHVRWGARRLREQALARPRVVAKHIALLPHADTRSLNVGKDGRERYRLYLLQWLGANMRDRVKAMVKSPDAK